mmetsp:Transcript_2434/g.8180  ORF Transcript_2434/g.8180 Transcript_2434/m.8180 type:complete len:248 (+) Transcript_2434:3493-4236(+)
MGSKTRSGRGRRLAPVRRVRLPPPMRLRAALGPDRRLLPAGLRCPGSRRRRRHHLSRGGCCDQGFVGVQADGRKDAILRGAVGRGGVPFSKGRRPTELRPDHRRRPLPRRRREPRPVRFDGRPALEALRSPAQRLEPLRHRGRPRLRLEPPPRRPRRRPRTHRRRLSGPLLLRHLPEDGRPRQGSPAQHSPSQEALRPRPPPTATTRIKKRRRERQVGEEERKKHEPPGPPPPAPRRHRRPRTPRET